MLVFFYLKMRKSAFYGRDLLGAHRVPKYLIVGLKGGTKWGRITGRESVEGKKGKMKQRGRNRQ